MKKLIGAAGLALALGVGTFAISQPAFATSTSHKYESTLKNINTPVRIEIKLSDELAYRADHLSKDIRDRANTRSLNDGFAGNGFFGQRELDKLQARFKKRLTNRLEKAGIKVEDKAPTVLHVVLSDAKPNRPTFKQLTKQASLSMSSFSIGGASFKAHLTKDDSDLGNADYGWYESNILNSYQTGTWSDAYLAMDKFARKLAKDLAGK